jgi:hypothetical protein
VSSRRYDRPCAYPGCPLRCGSIRRLARCLERVTLFPLKTMASIGSPTDEAPLQPGIRSIVSLAAAHTQKVYFSGTVDYHRRTSFRGTFKDFLSQNTYQNNGYLDDYHDRRVQLTGSIISVGQHGEKVSLPPVNVANAVRSPCHLRYLCDSAKPSSLVHRSLQTRSANLYRYWGWMDLPHLLLHRGSRFMACCLPALTLGEITPRGDLYRPSHPDYH